jgi:sortase A
MGYAAYEVASGKIYQAWRGRELDRALNSLPARPGPHPHPSYEQGSAIGRLEIPRIGLSVVVLEGSDTNTLRLGVGRIRNSALPSEPGNVVLAGHRDTFFRSLRDIRKGDRISFRTPEGTFPYTVDWTSVVNPADTSVIMPTRAPALTLVTCYPFYYVGAAPQRFIVRALPAEATNAAAPPLELTPRRPSPFDAPSRPATHPAAKPTKANDAVAVAAAPAAPAVVVKPAPAPSDPSAADDPQTRPGPLKRAFHKVFGVFSSHRDKLQ